MQLHYVVMFDTNTRQFNIDWDVQEAKFGLEHIYTDESNFAGWVSPNSTPFNSKVDEGVIKVLRSGLEMMNTMSDRQALKHTN